MARGIFGGKTRTLQPAEIISSPLFAYTDAVPRNDLQPIEQASSRSVPQTISHWDFRQPRTSQGRAQNTKTQDIRPGFDFQVTVPPAEAVPSHTHGDDGAGGRMIGVALGSPGLIGLPHTLPQMPSESVQPVKEQPKQTSLQRKPSKWRKIGGLFRAKSVVAQTPKQPFYQVRVEEWPLRNTPVSTDVRYQPEPEQWPEVERRRKDSSTKDGQKKEGDSTKAKEDWPRLKPEQLRSSEQEKSQPAFHIQDMSAKQRVHEQVVQAKASGPGTLLQIDIPDVQLERYSVMFNGILDNRQSPLMARRSKTLEGISIIEAERSLPLPRHQFQRRATSPTPSKSSSFTLFPAAQVTKASNILGSQNVPRGHSPSQRIQTPPAGQVSNSFDEDDDDGLVMVQSTSMKSSISTAFLDPERDERVPLNKIEQVESHVGPQEEPTWEMITRKTPANEYGSPLSSEGLSPLDAAQEQVDAIMEPKPPISPVDSKTQERVERLVGPSPGKWNISPVNNETQNKLDRLMRSKTTSPAASSPVRMPLTDENEDVSMNDGPSDITIPAVQVSIARSVSLSRGKRQVLVPIGPRADHLNADERLVSKGAKTPKVMDAQHGHRHGVSQDARIETI